MAAGGALHKFLEDRWVELDEEAADTAGGAPLHRRAEHLRRLGPAHANYRPEHEPGFEDVRAEAQTAVGYEAVALPQQGQTLIGRSFARYTHRMNGLPVAGLPLLRCREGGWPGSDRRSPLWPAAVGSRPEPTGVAINSVPDS